MTNGEKFKEMFSVTQVDNCDSNVYAWLPNHDAIEIPLEWWNAPYNSEDGKFSYLTFSYDENGERRGLILPSFKTADMYKGMVNGHVYDFDKLMENKG